MSRRRDYKTDYEIYLRLVAGNESQKQIADRLGMDKSIVSRRTRRLQQEGVLQLKVRSSIKVYRKGPGARAFIERAKEYIDTDGNASPPLPPGRVSQDKPPLEYWQGKSPRVHNLQFVCHLERPARGIESWGMPSLPGGIDWDVVTPSGNNPWETRGGTRHFLGEVGVPGWDKPARVHYTVTRCAGETVQIMLPATYVLRDWLDDVDGIEEYFVGVAQTVAELFRRSGWVLGPVEKSGRRFEYGFFVPVLEFLEGGGAFRVSDSVWVDFSKTDGQGRRPEVETNTPKVDDIPGAMEVFLRLPELEDSILKSLGASVENKMEIGRVRDDVASLMAGVAEIKTVLADFSQAAVDMKEVTALLRERVRPEDPETLRNMFR